MVAFAKPVSFLVHCSVKLHCNFHYHIFTIIYFKLESQPHFRLHCIYASIENCPLVKAAPKKVYVSIFCCELTRKLQTRNVRLFSALHVIYSTPSIYLIGLSFCRYLCTNIVAELVNFGRLQHMLARTVLP
jgi:hypothetical protein